MGRLDYHFTQSWPASQSSGLEPLLGALRLAHLVHDPTSRAPCPGVSLVDGL